MSQQPALSVREARREHRQSERLDDFVDGAFAFAITLLVISGSTIPHSVSALVHALRGVPAFAACFVQLAVFWRGHVRWRESSGQTDTPALVLSLLLVFLALIFVFPLHLVYSGFFSTFSNGALSPDFVGAEGSGAREMALLFVCYGLSFACMGGTLSALFVHGARRTRAMAHVPGRDVRMNAVFWAYFAAIGLLSMTIALLAGVLDAAWLVSVAGFSYALLALTGVVLNLYHKRIGKPVTS